MDNGFGGGDDSSASASYGNSSTDVYLKQVNRNSNKISKPVRKPSPLHGAAATSSTAVSLLDAKSGQSQQPPVYNINKNDFRDVVQKLTGSPAHERVSAPPQATQSSSRLQRIRPPPLAQIANRPPQIDRLPPRPLNDGVQRPPQSFNHPAAESPISAYMRFLQSSASPLWNGGAPIGQNDVGQRMPPPQSSMPPPQSSMPPTPSESPVSAYMRFLQSSASPIGQNGVSQPMAPPQSSMPPPSPVSAYMRFLQSSPSPIGQNGAAPPFLPPQQQQPPPSSANSPSPFPVLPLSPLPFGYHPSPRSPYSSLFSPMGQFGLPQLPLSPTLPLPSPRWKNV